MAWTALGSIYLSNLITEDSPVPPAKKKTEAPKKRFRIVRAPAKPTPEDPHVGTGTASVTIRINPGTRTQTITGPYTQVTKPVQSISSSTHTTWTSVKEKQAFDPPSQLRLAPAKGADKSYDLEDLKKKTHWTTGEAAWFCGLSRTSWHVYMTKRVGGWTPSPVTIGRGRGKESTYLDTDVAKYKSILDAR